MQNCHFGLSIFNIFKYNDIGRFFWFNIHSSSYSCILVRRWGIELIPNHLDDLRVLSTMHSSQLCCGKPNVRGISAMQQKHFGTHQLLGVSFPPKFCFLNFQGSFFKDRYFYCFTSHLWLSPYCGLDFHHSEVLKIMVSHQPFFSWDFFMMWGTEISFILENSCQNEIERPGGGF